MKAFFPYEAVTDGITVRVAPSYLAEQSTPASGRWVWSYHIRVENGSDAQVQLISRKWVITDAHGRVERVEGPGVVGEQPVIGSGGSYDYVSGCPLTTPSGMMRGSYLMVDEGGRHFEITIPAFSLDSPTARARPN